MTNRLVTVVLMVVVTVVLLWEAGRSVMTPVGRWQSWLQVLTAQQVADLLDRQVRLGEVTKLSLGSVEVRDLAIAEKFWLRDGTIARAACLRVDFDLARIARGQVAPAAGIGLVELEHLVVHAVRNEAGKLNLQDLLPKPTKPVPPEERFQGVVRIHEGEVIYDDYAVPTAHGEPLNVELTEIDAEVDMRRPGWAKVVLSARERLGRVGKLIIEAQTEMDSGFVWAKVDLSAIDVAWWYQTFVPGRDIFIKRAWADVTGTLGMVPGDGGMRTSASADIRLRDAAIRLAALGGREVVGNADASATLDGVQVHRLDARVGGVQLNASGLLGDFGDPVLDLSFEAHAPRPEAVLDLIPGDIDLQQQLASLAVTGPILASGRLSGPIGQAMLSARASVPGRVRYASEQVGSFEAGPLDLRVDVVDLADPSVRAQAQIRDVDPTDVTPLAAMLPTELQGERVAIAPIAAVQTDLLWSAQLPVAHTRMALPRVEVGTLAVDDISADLALIDNMLLVRELHAEPLGAQLSADCVVDLSDAEAPWVWARGEIAGLRAERVQRLPWLQSLEETLGGTVSARFAGSFDPEGSTLVAQAMLDSPSYGPYGVESARGIAVLDDSGVQVRGLRFEDPLGSGWARAVVPFEGELAASFAVAGVELEKVADRFERDADDLRGEVYVAGDVRGTIDNPEVDATIRAFQAGWGRYTIDAAVGEIRGGLESLRIDALYASAGRIVARVDGALNDLDLETRNASLDGRVVIAGPVDEYALDLADLRDQDIAGAVRADITVGGTLKRPSARGRVWLPYAHYDTMATDDTIALVSLQGDVLQLEELRVPVGDAVVTGNGAMVSLYDQPTLSLSARAEGVVLQNLAPWQEVDLPLSGQVDVPYLSLSGPLDALSGVAQISAIDLELGGEKIGAISALLTFNGNTLELPRTTLNLAGGTLAVSSKIRLDEKRILPSEIVLSDVSIAKLLRLAVPLAERFADQPGGEESSEGGQPLSKQLAALSMRLTGRLNGSLSVEGTIPSVEPAAGFEETMQTVLETVSGRVDELAVRDAAFDGIPLPDTTVNARITDEAAVELSVTAEEGDALITADGTWHPNGKIEMLADVFALDLAGLRRWLPDTVPSFGGKVYLTVEATGSLDVPQLVGTISVEQPEIYGAEFDIIQAPPFHYDGKTLEIDSLVVRAGDEEIYIDGRLPFDWATRSIPQDGELRIVARMDKTDLAIFPPILATALASGTEEPGPLAEVKAIGTVDSLIEIGGTAAHPELTGELTIAAPRIDTPWLSSPIEDMTLAVTFRGAEGKTIVELPELSARAESTTLEAGGRAELTHFDLAHLNENVYDLKMSIAAPQQRFGELLAKRVRGTITLATKEDGRQLVTIEDLGADFGDGSVLLGGTVELTTFVPAELANNIFDLELRADHARPRYSNLFLGTVNGLITGRTPAPGEKLRIEGAMEVSHAIIGLPRSSGEKDKELRGMPADFPSPSMNVRLAIGPDVRIKTTGLTAPLEPTERAVVVRGTPQRPTIQGLIEAQQGEASVTGGVLNIETAGARFLIRPGLGTRQRKPPIPLDMEGRLWAQATRTINSAVINGREVGPIEIQLQVNGTLLPLNIVVQATSTPPLAEEQIYALLGTSPFAGESQLAQRGDLQDVMTEQFLTALSAAFRHYVFQPFEEELREMLGLSVFEVTFAYDQPMAVRIGGYLVDDLLVTYKTSFAAGQEQYDLQISYKVERRFQVGFSTDEANNNKLFVEYVKSF